MDKIVIPTTGQLSVPDSAHKWEIPNFCLGRWKTGQMLASPFIFIPDTELQIHLYPRGINEDVKDYVSVALKTLHESTVGIRFSFSIVNNESQKMWMPEGTPSLFAKGYVEHGKLISQNYLMRKSSKFLPKNKLTISCEIKTMNTTFHNDKHNRALIPTTSGSFSKISRFGDFDRYFNN